MNTFRLRYEQGLGVKSSIISGSFSSFVHRSRTKTHERTDVATPRHWGGLCQHSCSVRCVGIASHARIMNTMRTPAGGRYVRTYPSGKGRRLRLRLDRNPLHDVARDRAVAPVVNLRCLGGGVPGEVLHVLQGDVLEEEVGHDEHPK